MQTTKLLKNRSAIPNREYPPTKRIGKRAVSYCIGKECIAEKV